MEIPVCYSLQGLMLPSQTSSSILAWVVVFHELFLSITFSFARALFQQQCFNTERGAFVSIELDKPLSTAVIVSIRNPLDSGTPHAELYHFSPFYKSQFESCRCFAVSHTLRTGSTAFQHQWWFPKGVTCCSYSNHRYLLQIEGQRVKILSVFLYCKVTSGMALFFCCCCTFQYINERKNRSGFFSVEAALSLLGSIGPLRWRHTHTHIHTHKKNIFHCLFI